MPVFYNGTKPESVPFPRGTLEATTDPQAAIEDLIGAGAVIHALEGTRSPEAEAAARVFEANRDDLESVLCATGSGKELKGRGFAADVRLAAVLDESRCVPVLKDGVYRTASLERGGATA